MKTLSVFFRMMSDAVLLPHGEAFGNSGLPDHSDDGRGRAISTQMPRIVEPRNENIWRTCHATPETASRALSSTRSQQLSVAISKSLWILKSTCFSEASQVEPLRHRSGGHSLLKRRVWEIQRRANWIGPWRWTTEEMKSRWRTS